VAYLCPTEILATQQFESFIRYFSYLGVSVGLITGNGCRKFPSKINPTGWTDISRSQFLTWVANGEIPIVIGTHALIQKSVVFRHLAYVIIDEQHRFGTKQRAALIKKNVIAPHLLSMTATPIPRTLALTAFGDLDLTVLDALPVGRKPVITKIVGADERARGQVYNHIRGELAAGRQAYVICPRIDDPDPAQEAALQARSAIAEAKRLKKDIFPEQSIDVLHSKMLPAKKDAVMAAFAAGKINILCATSVVEVGVNVPNATIMIIEGGERFGLAQLHQLRGRVQRSSTQAYCYVFTSNGGTETTSERLKAFTAAKNGFELAEYDLAFRGAGELLGGKQWGISDVAMEALANIKLVEAARLEAGKILDTDPLLQEAHHTALIHEMNRRHRESGHAHLE
jgi:ATP-dependent DNA helicase RecG